MAVTAISDTPFGKGRIVVHDMSHFTVSAGSYYDEEAQEGFQVNGVMYRVSYDFKFKPDTGWSISYTYSGRQGSLKAFDGFTTAATKKFDPSILEWAKKWAKDSADLLTEAERVSLAGYIADEQKNLTDLQAKYNEAEAKLRSLEQLLAALK